MDLAIIEKEIQELCQNIKILAIKSSNDSSYLDELESCKRRIEEKDALFKKLLPAYKIVQLSRALTRPSAADIIKKLFTSFVELRGDRAFADDEAILAGFGIFRGQRVCLIGHHKGKNTKENIKRNFGMPKPEGYRKAVRIMELANRFKLPVLTLIDTPGAYPGLDAEARGQCQAIAQSIFTMGELNVPSVAIVIGEGGSGGALALGVANRVLITECSTYSVITPEGCASILWRDASKASEASAALQITARSALELGLVDAIVPEPLGGAHLFPEETIKEIGNALEQHLKELLELSKENSAFDFRQERMKKFLNMGLFFEQKILPSASI